MNDVMNDIMPHVPVLLALVALLQILTNAMIKGAATVYQHYFAPKPVKHSVREKRNANHYIFKVLVAFCLKMNASKIYIAMFHNGGEFSNGIGMDHFSKTFEYVNPDHSVRSSIKQFKNSYVSEHIEILQPLCLNGYYDMPEIKAVGNTKEVIDEYGYKSFYLRAFYKGIDPEPVGYVGLHFTNKVTILQKIQLMAFENMVRKIAPYINLTETVDNNK